MSKKETKIVNLDTENRGFDFSEPEKELMLAILKSAVTDLEKGDKASMLKAKRFFLNQENDYIFSFLSICELLSVTPGKIIEETGLANDTEFMHSYQQQYSIF